MANIEKISMQGFKSFKRRVAIPFDSGFSVITGPNGSGKTNCADGIYFVLGMGTSRTLRAKKAQELIFGGSKKKSASDYAKVEIFMNNDEKKIPVDDKEVVVSRRVNKAGVSTYRLNGRVMPRKEIMNLLCQAGIQSDGHNLLQQGEVTRVIEINPVQRREVIDEIAGIMEYDEKKDKAMKELEKVENKVREAEIVLEQKDEIMERIKADRDAAVTYKKLQQELRMLNASAILKELRSTEKKLSGIDKETGDQSGEAARIERELKGLEAKVMAKESEIDKISKQILKASDRLEESDRINELRSKIAVRKERIRMNDEQIGSLGGMIDRLSNIEKKESYAVKEVKGMKGVVGTFSDLIMVPPQYKVAIEIAAGGHLNDVVVETHHDAVTCINHLKQTRSGRARFLPMNKIEVRGKSELPKGCVGWLSDLVHNEPKHTAVINYVLGSTACVKDIERAKEMMEGRARVRMVTLEGDLIERSGAMTGGYIRKGSGAQVNQYIESRKKLDRENDGLRMEIERLEKELKSVSGSGKAPVNLTGLEKKRGEITDDIDKLRHRRDELYEKRASLQEQTGRVGVRKAKYEAAIENLQADWERCKDMEKEVEEGEYYKQPLGVLHEKRDNVIERMNLMGDVNLKAIEEYESFRKDFEEMKGKVEKIMVEKKSIVETIEEIETKKRGVFMKTFDRIAIEFRKVYGELTGGEADLRLQDENDLNSGLMIYASPPGKKLLNIDSMSTGEKTLTSFAFLFAIQNYKPAPFYVMDEADAALDKTNTKLVADLVRRHSKLAQFIIISHNDHMIKEADQVYGVSMEDGESKIMGIKLHGEPGNEAG